MDKAINRASFKVLIFLFITLIFSSCKAQPVSIKLLNGPVFAKGNSIKYTVSSPKVVYYYASLESYIDGRWQEIVLDIISTAPQQAAVLQKISAKVSNHEYRVNAIPADYVGDKEPFRLKLTYGESPTTANKVVFSEKFTINLNGK
ncbi:hypothetical protein MUGA111182_13230 [Mucilaginibacter galii]|uniref:Uncharacterized protein n=1 Tax=Mucilaginibacter galii TaxID=2005073 RepID=A0A917J5W8_9SPHI|nr:hypothetical protein [Mucilaginibacter galii]GGI49269.1 hypothetical protein GCM10011425_04810 [Mucilaginibacter galii]